MLHVKRRPSGQRARSWSDKRWKWALSIISQSFSSDFYSQSFFIRFLPHLANKQSFLTSCGIQANSKELDLPYIYWIPKMHTIPYKHRFIAGSSKCSTKPLFILLTKLLTHIKQGLQEYCETAYSRSGVNHMWILKNSKELLYHLKSPNFNLITNINSFDFFDPLHNHSSPET